MEINRWSIPLLIKNWQSLKECCVISAISAAAFKTSLKFLLTRRVRIALVVRLPNSGDRTVKRDFVGIFFDRTSTADDDDEEEWHTFDGIRIDMFVGMDYALLNTSDSTSFPCSVMTRKIDIFSASTNFFSIDRLLLLFAKTKRVKHWILMADMTTSIKFTFA